MKNSYIKKLPLIILIPVTVFLSLNFRGGCSICEFGTFDNRAISYSEDNNNVFIVSNDGRLRIYDFSEFNCSLLSDTMLSNSSLNAVKVKNIVQALTCGDNGKIFRNNSVDYDNWDSVSSGTMEGLNDIDFIGTKVYIVGNNGTILKSIDFGMTFFPVNSGTTLDLYEVQCISFDSIRIAGENLLSMYTTNGGNSWIQQFIPIEADDLRGLNINAQHFIDFNTGWAAGYYYIFKTTNAGLNWNTYFKIPQFYDNNTNAIHFYNKDSGIAVGNRGDVQFSTNGGSLWFYAPELQDFTTKNLNEIIYSPETGNAAIVGDSGIIIHADSVLFTPRTLSLTFLIQGFYDPVSDNMIRDTASVYLRSASSPYFLIDSSKAYVDSAGHGIFTFGHSFNLTPYYVIIKHRNSIETWSSSAVSFVSNSLTYDFTGSDAFAYGNNMVHADSLPVKYAVYSGDVNQEGTVDISDIIEVYNDAAIYNAGYLRTDLNGDNLTDLTDVSLAFNNSQDFVSKIVP